MKQFIFFILFGCLFTNSLAAQSGYMSGNYKYCELSPSFNEKFKLGMEALSYKKYEGVAAKIFLDIVKQQPNSCDSFFWAGYSFRMQNRNKEAFACFYIADSLNQNKSIEFKQSLAVTSFIIDKIDFSRAKYEEIIKFFPDSPEGYYGVAITSPMIGDFKNGLDNVLIAIEKYGDRNNEIMNQTELMLGLLLALNKNYDTALVHFDECSSKYKKDLNFNIYYSLSLLKVAETNNDEKMKKQAKKIYDRIANKDDIPLDLQAEFKF